MMLKEGEWSQSNVPVRAGKIVMCKVLALHVADSSPYNHVSSRAFNPEHRAKSNT